MANHSVAVTFQKLNENQNGNSVQRTFKKTNAVEQFTKKSSSSSGLGGNIVKGIRNIRSFNVSATLGSFGGSMPAIAIAQEATRIASKGVDIYTQIQTAKTGEVMKYRNIQKAKSALLNPVGFMVDMYWSNGYIKNMEISRENIKLNYDRKLTGDLIYSQNTQHTLV